MENRIKSYEISLWKDTYDENKKYYKEEKIMVIGSNTMKTSNRAFSPVLKQNLNGETTLEFSLSYQIYNEFTNVKTINPFIPLLINERKVKLKYGDEWFDFIIKDKQESSENTFTYTCIDANILELSKRGYNVELSTELKNNQGTVIELGKEVVKDSNWSIDEQNTDILHSYVDEPVYRGKLKQNLSVYKVGVGVTSAETLTIGTEVFVFYSQITNKLTTNLQFVKIKLTEDGKIDEKEFEFDDTGAAKATNYVYKDADLSYTDDGFPDIFDTTPTLFTDYQVKRLVRNQKTLYDKIMEQFVDTYQIAGSSQEIYHYQKSIYTTSDVLVNYMANSDNFELSVEGTTNGWNVCSTDLDKNFLTINTFPNIKKIASDPTATLDVRNYLTMTLDQNVYVYNSGIQGNRHLIKSFVEGERYSFKIRAGRLNGDSIENIPLAEQNFRMIVAGYTVKEGHQVIDDNRILFDFTSDDPEKVIKEEENIVIKDGMFDNNNTQYIIDGVVQTPNPMYYYQQEGGVLHKWNPVEKKYTTITDNDLRFYRFDAFCQRSISDLVTSDEEIGIFIKNIGSKATYYIESIQLFKYIEVNGNKLMIGEPMESSTVQNDYFYLAPKANTKKNSISLYSSKPDIAAAIGVPEGNITPKFDETCQMVSIIEAQDTNYFDILQQLCEKFECWMKFIIEREDNGAPKIDATTGRPSKKIAFKKFIGRDNWAGFKYGINLVKIERNVSSEEVVTKLIVPQSENQYTDDGYVTIQEAKSNLSGLNYILNFNYFIKKGLLDSSLNNLTQFYKDIGEKNKQIIEKQKEKAKVDLSITKLEAQKNVFSELLANANSVKGEALVDFKDLTEQSYSSYIQSHSELGIDTKQNSLLELITKIKTCEYYISTYGSSTQALTKELQNQKIKSSGYPEYTIEIEKTDVNTYTWSVNDYVDGIKFTLEGNGGSVDIETNFYTKSGTLKFAPTSIEITDVPDGYKTKTSSISEYPFSIVVEPQNEGLYKVGLEYEIEKIIKEKEKIEQDYLNKFGAFIQEGTWNSNEYVDSELYYLDAVKAAYNSGKPQVEYTIDVIEISGIEEFKNYEFKIGDKTYMEDTDFFGYVSIDDVPTPVKEQVIVTEVTHHLDSPEEDSISVRNYKTEFEDLFQRLAATTQSIQYKEGSYARAASAIDVSGIINPQVLLNTFDAIGNEGWNLTNSGIISITSDGIIGTDVHDANRKIKIGAGIIYTTTDGGKTWIETLTPDGIGTKLLTAGRINTDKIFIMNDKQPAFRWDKVGLNAFYYDKDENKYRYNTFVRFDQYGIYGVEKNEWEDARKAGVPESEYEYFVPTSVDDIENNAMFGLTWKGFFLKSLYNDGYVSISNTDDIEVKRTDPLTGKTNTIIKIGAFRKDKNKKVVDKYGIRIADYNGNSVFETGSDGKLFIRNAIQVGDMESADDSTPAIVIDGLNSEIRSSNYSDGAGLGWLIDKEGDAYFNNITARGAIKTAVFEYAEIQAVGGVFLFRPSSTIKKARISTNGKDLILEVEKAHLFRAEKNGQSGDWCKISNYLNESGEPDPRAALSGNGLSHVYKVSNAAGKEVVLEDGVKILGKDTGLTIDSLIGGALVSMGREDRSDNYGIGVNSSDNTVNLPRKSISLFDTKIHPNESVKVTYDYKGILGTLPDLGDASVNQDIYKAYMEGTQGIFTNNMYIGDNNQYIAFYKEDDGTGHLKINANDLIFGYDETTKDEISWNQIINQTRENAIVSSLGYLVSGAGDVGYIYPRAFKNGVELDPLPFNVVTQHGTEYPPNPQEGDYFLLLIPSSRKAICQQYTNGEWVDVIWDCSYDWTFQISQDSKAPTVDPNQFKNRFVYIDSEVVAGDFTAKVNITSYLILGKGVPDPIKIREEITIRNGLSQRYFWFNSTTISDKGILSGAYVLDTPVEDFKINGGYYALVRSKGSDATEPYGFIIGENSKRYMILNDKSLNFYDENEKIRMSLTGTELAFYKPGDFDTPIKDATLTAKGLVLNTGGLEAGTKNTADYIYLYSHDDASHEITISGHKASDWRIVAGKNFGVDKGGNLYASNATINGDIVAKTLTIGNDPTSVSTANILNTNVHSQNFSEGTSLYKDPLFAVGTNGTLIYNNASNTNVTWTRATKSSDNPLTGTNYEMVCKNTGTASPGLGGFSWRHASRANAIYLYRIIAKIPTGHNIQFASNSTGTGGNYTREWVTSNAGTGAFKEYIFKSICGNTGSFSSTGFFYIDGTPGTTSSPVTWNVAYAAAFDMTNKSEVNNYITSIDSTGIKIAPADSSKNNYLQINSANITFYRSGQPKAQWTDDWFGLGDLNSTRITLSTVGNSSFGPYIYMNADGKAAFQVAAKKDGSDTFMDLFADGKIRVKINKDGTTYYNASGGPTGAPTATNRLANFSDGVYLYKPGTDTALVSITTGGASFTGTVNADAGRIGGTSGWTIASQQLYSGTIGTNGSLHLGTKNLGSNTSIAGRSGSDWRLTVGSKFGVTNSGALFANGGNIGGWNISANDFWKYNSASTRYFCINANNVGTDSNVLSMGTRAVSTDSLTYPFYVTGNGKLTATDADIKGKVTATSFVAMNGTKKVAEFGSAIQFWDDSDTPVERLKIDTKGVRVGTATDNATITSDGMVVNKGNDQVASFSDKEIVLGDNGQVVILTSSASGMSSMLNIFSPLGADIDYASMYFTVNKDRSTIDLFSSDYGHIGIDSDNLNPSILFQGSNYTKMKIDMDNGVSILQNRGLFCYDMEKYVVRPYKTDTIPLCSALGNGSYPTRIYGTKILKGNGTAEFATSDERIKKDFTPIDNAKDFLMDVNTFSFKWDTDSELWEEEGTNDGRRNFGVSAQQVLKTLEEHDIDPDEYSLVSSDEHRYYVSYEQFIPLLIKTVQDQQKEIEELKQEIQNIKGGIL